MFEVFYTSLSAQIVVATHHSRNTLYIDQGFPTIQMYYDFVCMCSYVVENSRYFTILTCTQTLLMHYSYIYVQIRLEFRTLICPFLFSLRVKDIF